MRGGTLGEQSLTVPVRYIGDCGAKDDDHRSLRLPIRSNKVLIEGTTVQVRGLVDAGHTMVDTHELVQQCGPLIGSKRRVSFRARLRIGVEVLRDVEHDELRIRRSERVDLIDDVVESLSIPADGTQCVDGAVVACFEHPTADNGSQIKPPCTTSELTSVVLALGDDLAGLNGEGTAAEGAHP